MRRFFVSLCMVLLCVNFLQALPKAKQSSSTGKWGFVEGINWVIKPVYDNYDMKNAFCGNSKKFAVVQSNGKWGAINAEGKYISNPVFSTKELAFRAAKLYEKNSSKDALLCESYDVNYKKWGFVDYTGEMYFRPIYEEIDAATSFAKGYDYTIVRLDGQWGAVDRSGVMVLNPYFVSKEDARAAAKEWQTKAVLGETLYLGLKSNVKKIGFINYLGNWVTKPVFDNVDKTSLFSKTSYFAVVKYKGRWAAIDRAGNFVVKPTHSTSAAAKKAAIIWQQSNSNTKVPATLVPNLESFTYKTPNLSAQPSSNSSKKQTVQQTSDKNQSTMTETTTNKQNTSSSSDGVPTINIITPRNGSQYSNTEVTFVYETRTYDGSNPEIIAYVNGELQPRTKGVRRVGKQITLTLPRVSDCRVQLIAKDNKGRNSDPAVVLLHYRGDRPKPALHVFAVGISDYDQSDLKLQHAAKDAEDFMNTVKTCNLSQYQSMKTSNLILDKSASDKSIKKGLSSLVNTVEQGDVVLLFFSGHGAKEGAETYFLSSNAESNDLFATAVDFDVIRSALKRLKDRKCRIIIFMDACHSGSMYGMKSTAETFSMAEPDIIGFYSSTEVQKSNESEQWENGIFTKALLEGIKGAATDEEGNVTLDALELYIRNQVRQSTKGKQMPIFENRQGNFILFEKK